MNDKIFARFAALLCAAVLCLALAGCDAGAALPEGVTEDGVTAAAAATVAQLNDKDYAALLDSCNAEMTAAMTQSTIADAWEPFYEKAGAFVSIDKTQVVAQKGYAVAVVSATYENTTATFTLSYDGQLALAGLYFK